MRIRKSYVIVAMKFVGAVYVCRSFPFPAFTHQQVFDCNFREAINLLRSLREQDADVIKGPPPLHLVRTKE